MRCYLGLERGFDNVLKYVLLFLREYILLHVLSRGIFILGSGSFYISIGDICILFTWCYDVAVVFMQFLPVKWIWFVIVCWGWVPNPNPPILWRSPLLLTHPLFFQILLNPPPLLFLLRCFFGWFCDDVTSVLFCLMILWTYFSSLGTLVSAPPCMFYTTSDQVYWRCDTDDMVFTNILIWCPTHRQTHTGHVGVNRLTQTYKYILKPAKFRKLNPPSLLKRGDSNYAMFVPNFSYNLVIFYSTEVGIPLSKSTWNIYPLFIDKFQIPYFLFPNPLQVLRQKYH